MKKLFALFALLLIPAIAEAREDFTKYPMPNTHSNQAIYISTRINYNSATPPGPVIISSYPAYLYGIVISSVGSSDAKLEVFDSNVSTSRVTFPNIRQIVGIDVSRTAPSLPPIPFEVFCGSGITINNTGTTVADVTLLYREH